MEKVAIFLLMATRFLENIKMEGLTGKECINGKMGVYTLVISKME
jgi:hypothetical protein